MRRPEYFSPSGMKTFMKDREEWYIKYVSDYKPPRQPQTQPMSIGSAFDAYVKSYLHSIIYGHGTDPEFERDSLFEKQVEEQHRDWARHNGEECFKMYKASGALNDLLLELNSASSAPQFEIEVRGPVSHETMCKDGIVLLGKPDVYFRNKDNHIVILDWKVNGWCGKGNTSPKKGYVKIRDGRGIDTIGSAHKDAYLTSYRGVTINEAVYLEEIEEDWAAQLCTYGWLLGAPVGDEFVTCIDQIACKNVGERYPSIRVAEHRTRVSAEFQELVFSNYNLMRVTLDTGHIFPGFTKEMSDGRCMVLDEKAKQICLNLECGQDYFEAFKAVLG